jgi:hypothetical protein
MGFWKPLAARCLAESVSRHTLAIALNCVDEIPILFFLRAFYWDLLLAKSRKRTPYFSEIVLAFHNWSKMGYFRLKIYSYLKGTFTTNGSKLFQLLYIAFNSRQFSESLEAFPHPPLSMFYLVAVSTSKKKVDSVESYFVEIFIRTTIVQYV